MRRFLGLIAILALLYLIFPQEAYAYLDPGTGSYVFQMIVAALAGGLFAIKLFWTKIKAWFATMRKKMKSQRRERTPD